MITFIITERKKNDCFIKFFLCYILVSFFLLVCFFSRAEPTAQKQRFGISVKTQPQQRDSSVDHVRNSIWKIKHNSESSAGTAFFIGPNLFVTNFHVLQLMLADDNSLKQVVLQQEGTSHEFSVSKVIAVSALHDLVLVETKKSVPSYLNLKEGIPQSIEKLFVLGYPQGQFIKMGKTGQISDGSFFYIFPVNHSRLEGASGSPVLNTEGQVVGIVHEASANMLIAKKSDHLKDLISKKTGQYCDVFINLENCIKKEMENLEKLAEQGFAQAQYELAMIYYFAYGTALNWPLAVDWVKRSAKQGFVRAQYQLAQMYHFGEGTKTDWPLAVDWMKRSAEQGYFLAQYKLARMHYFAYGTALNWPLALFWYKKAAEQGDIDSQYRLAEMYAVGKGTEPNQLLAFDWYKKAAEQGHANSQYKLAKMYAVGKGIEPDQSLASFWYKKAARQGHILAGITLSMMRGQ